MSVNMISKKIDTDSFASQKRRLKFTLHLIYPGLVIFQFSLHFSNTILALLNVFIQSRPRYIVFTDLVKTTDLYARNVSLIDYEWVRPICEEYKKGTFK